MSRIRLIGALSISVALIGGAMWFRFVRTNPSSAHIVSIPEIKQFSSEDTSLEDFFNTNAQFSTASTTPLSQTDLVARQLFSDYIELTSKGKPSSEKLNSLAGKYAESILSATPPIRVEGHQIIILPNSEENLSRYGQSVAAIRDKYKNLIERQFREGDTGDINSPTFKTFISAAGKLYMASANELLVVGAPASLAENHKALVNNYFGSALAMEALANATVDPVSAYAAMNTQAKNTAEEADLFLNIQMTMIANGIIFERGI
ncbi:MAG: hypothetical protein Q8Q92_04750 [bacterium]|nr:hypothetical protein [bacterium]